MSIVGRCERSDLRHFRGHLGCHVGGRYPRSDLQYYCTHGRACLIAIFPSLVTLYSISIAKSALLEA